VSVAPTGAEAGWASVAPTGAGAGWVSGPNSVRGPLGERRVQAAGTPTLDGVIL
jgi:hypothetical protein